jgi:hypothetical protein
MSIGIGVFLIVVGAVLAFAVKTHVQGIDLVMVGYILIGAGVVVVLASLLFLIPRSRRSRSTAVTTDSMGRQYVTERDDRTDGV